ncbi:MAG: 2OG-Fe(II) oxygenase [Chloroherpetonaceae bacterium]|nr:2OG-Fe(II) oxygenase [Chloroherpetonaceae bacterium]MDW8019333.1 2OG-Fe(II) oxygenase [Chloroherpetonaceae bacterium]MDW8465474.1 2OG-Fe(II) oxygenase [Chloroherpetonaceae bacterium]
MAIATETLRLIQPKWLEPETLLNLKRRYDTAHPYPHIAIDGFLDESVATMLYEHFPKLSQMKTHYDGLNERKAEDSQFEQYHPIFRELRAELFSPTFLRFLETLTGISNLTTCEGPLGAGTHQGGNGSYLDLHIDFNIHPTEPLHRRINVLIFLNKFWKEDYGGQLELWDEHLTACGAAYLPIFNRCVIFETNDRSYHGYSKISVPAHESRKSFYAYYYTPAPKEIKYHDTTFRTRPNEPFTKKAQTLVKEHTKNFIKRQLKNLGLIELYNRTFFALKTRNKEKAE